MGLRRLRTIHYQRFPGVRCGDPGADWPWLHAMPGQDVGGVHELVAAWGAVSASLVLLASVAEVVLLVWVL
jgi:hypothetical protein